MSDEYIKLAEPPTLAWSYPECSACEVEVGYEDGFICPSCGTMWNVEPYDESTPGDLYENWSGERLNGPTIANEDAPEKRTYRTFIEEWRADRAREFGRELGRVITGEEAP